MMQFSVGDKIVHPYLGAGRITAIREKSDNDTEPYYVIEIPAKELTTYIPASRTVEVGMRRVMSRSKLARVLRTLRSRSDDLPDDYRERQEQIEKKIETGRPLLIAEAVRDLTRKKRTGNLTKKDADLLSQGREFLIGEMAMVTDLEAAEARKALDEALEKGLAEEEASAS